MDKTERIREDCHVLVAGEDGSTKAGQVLSSYYALKPWIHHFFSFLKAGIYGLHFLEFGIRL